MKLDRLLSLMAASLLLLVSACDKENDLPEELRLGAPVLSEVSAPQAVATSAMIVDKNDLETGAIRVMAYGFCYAVSKNPTIYSSTVTTLPEDGMITATLTGLTDNTTYYVRAFATLYPSGVVYSPETEMTVGFVTIPSDDQ